jgi:hypothetical protein
VQALQKGLVEPFTVVRPNETNGSPLAPAVAVAPATVPVVFPPLSLGGHEAPDGSDLLSKWVKEASPDVRWLYQTRLTMRKLSALVGHDDATRVTRSDVIRFKEQLVERNLKAPTINRYLSELRGPFAWGFANDKIGTNPSNGVVFAGKSQGRAGARDTATDRPV